MAADEKTCLAIELINGGTELAGSVIGGAIGSVGGPGGIVGGEAAGVAATRVLRRVGAEVHQRLLAPRQRVRVGAAYAFAADAISAQLVAGYRPRTDGFFEDDPTGRSPADELLEGVLSAAADAYEERKVRFLGWLYASLAFADDVSRPYANLMISQAEHLRFRQLCVLAILGERDDTTRVATAAGDDPAQELRFSDDLGLEVDELERFGLVGGGARGDTYKRGGATFVDAGSLSISQLNLTGPGERLFELMNLGRIAHEARLALLDELVPTVSPE